MYKISYFSFNLNYPLELSMPDNMEKFFVEGKTNEYTYEIKIVNQIIMNETHFILNKSNIKICMTGQLEKRYLFITGDMKPYGCFEEVDKKNAIILIDQDYLPLMKLDTMFASLLCLERKMNNYHSYVLHSSYIVYQNKAILFTAPSGTGKSTQAGLWEKYRGASVKNGDRTLIKKEDDTFYACGWPICGSSEICFNETYPLACIVVLSQATKNTIDSLSYKDSVKKLLSEITINYHNPQFINQAMDFISDLCLNVPIYHLGCNISEDAVVCLENQLKEDLVWMR